MRQPVRQAGRASKRGGPRKGGREEKGKGEWRGKNTHKAGGKCVPFVFEHLANANVILSPRLLHVSLQQDDTRFGIRRAFGAVRYHLK